MVASSQIKLKHLFAPLNHEKIILKNRIMQMAMLTRFCDEDGYVTDRYIAFMLARARGGTAVIATGCSCMLKEALFRPNELGCHDDSYIPGLQRLTSALHEHD